MLDSQFRGIKDAMSQSDPQAMQRVKDMMSALTSMIDADARGEHTQQDFDDFMSTYGEFFPDSPQNLEELVDSLVRRLAAAQRLLNSLTDEQRNELAGLMAQTLEDAGRNTNEPVQAKDRIAAGVLEGLGHQAGQLVPLLVGE